MKISSTTNPTVKMVARLQRDRRFRHKQRLFVVEGERWLREVDALGIIPDYLFSTDKAGETEPDEGVTTVTAAVMAVMSDQQTPSGRLAVLPMPTFALPQNGTLWLVLDQIQTPGNLGTLLRTATAAGVDGVLLTQGCVDLYNPKVVRAAMGALLRLPIMFADWETIAAKTAGTQVMVAEAGGEMRYDVVDWSRPSTIIIGNEANGPSAQAHQLSTPIHIPMAGSESLNAAVAGSILLYEVARQRQFNF